MSTEKKAKKVKAKKPKLTAFEKAPAVLTKEELKSLGSVLDDLKRTKENHTNLTNSLQVQQTRIQVKLAQAKQLQAEAVQDEADTTYTKEELLRVERKFNAQKQRKEILVADICNKRGISVQEFEYNQETGEILNIVR